jgi:hypothetical protein
MKSELWWLTPVIRATQEAGLWFEASWEKQFMRPYLKTNPSKKRAGRMAQGVGLNSSTTKINKYRI